jgi:hypothetical protein
MARVKDSFSYMHHLTIIDTPTTKCVWLRIRRNGKAFQQSFPFKRYGGKKQAIEAAIKIRNIEGKKIYGDSWPLTKYSEKLLSSSNLSGTIGVSFSSSNHSWVASWQAGPRNLRKQKNAYFSVEKYGHGRSKKMAVHKRKLEVTKNKVNYK